MKKGGKLKKTSMAVDHLLSFRVIGMESYGVVGCDGGGGGGGIDDDHRCCCLQLLPLRHQSSSYLYSFFIASVTAFLMRETQALI